MIPVKALGYEISPPTGAPTLEVGSTAGNIGTGQYRYAISFVTHYGETIIGPSSSITATGSVRVSGFPQEPSNAASGLNIYRTSVGEIQPYRLVGTVKPSDGFFIDTLSDAARLGEPPFRSGGDTYGVFMGDWKFNKPLVQSTETALSATGSTREGAANVSAEINYVVAPNPDNGVVLPAISTRVIGLPCAITNNGVNNIKIYPNESTTTIAGNPAGDPIDLASGQTVELICFSETSWVQRASGGGGGGGIQPGDPAGGSLAGTYPAPTLSLVGPGGGPYTNATISLNSEGRVTAASSGAAVTSITAGAGLTGGTITSTGTIGLDTELTGIDNITGLGAVVRSGPGVYTAGVLSETRGGTGNSAYAEGDLLYGSSLNLLSKLAKPSTASLLEMDNSGIPIWSSKGDILAGLDPKEPSEITTIANIAGYTTAISNGQFTGVDTTSGALFDLGAYVVSLGDRILVKDQTDPLQNGIYAVTAGPLNSATLTRVGDMDGTPANEVSAGNFTFVQEGGANQFTGWVVAGQGIKTLNTDPIVWYQFSSTASLTAGTGLSIAGTVISLDTPVSVPNGGTGLSTIATGSLVYGAAPNVYGEIADGTTSQVLVGGGGTGPVFGAVPNTALANNSLTINAGTGLSGGGVVALGGSTTISLDTPISVADGGTGLTALGGSNQLLGMNVGATALEFKSSIDLTGTGSFDGSLTTNDTLNTDNISAITAVLAEWAQRGSSITGESGGTTSGTSVDSNNSGRTIIIGDPNNSGAAANAGHARVYDWTGLIWTQRGPDIDGTAAADEAGSAVSISADGNTIAVGSPRNDIFDTDAGQVRVFDWSGTTWIQRGADILGNVQGGRFGAALSLRDDGNVIVVGAPQGPSFTGRVRTFEWSGTAWLQRGVDILGGTNDALGTSVDISDDSIVVGIPLLSPASVRVYDWDGTNWNQRGVTITNGASDNFGNSVSMGSPIDIIVGANGASPYARAYRWDGAVWNPRGADITGLANDGTGISVHMTPSVNTIAVGANSTDVGFLNEGTVRVLDYNGVAWVQRGPNIVGGAANIGLGYSTVLSDDGIITISGARVSNQTRIYCWIDDTNRIEFSNADLFGVESITVTDITMNGRIEGALVNSFSGGQTGLKPNPSVNGDVVLSGVLRTTHGGTGLQSIPVGSILYAQSDNVLNTIADGTVGQVLLAGGGTGPVFGAPPASTLPNVGPGPGPYGSASSIPVFDLDAQGRVTTVTPTQLTAIGSPLTSAQILVGSASNTAAAVAMSGDAELTSAGVVSVNQLSGENAGGTGLQISTTSGGTSSIYFGYTDSAVLARVNNIGIGFESLNSVGTGVIGTDNIAIGLQAGAGLVNGNTNIIVGNRALDTTDASNNLVIGHDSASALALGGSNVIFGNQSGTRITNGSRNIVIGRQAGRAITSGTNSVVVGHRALGDNVGTFLGADIIAIGFEAGFNFKGSGAAPTAVFIGSRAGFNSVADEQSTFIGFEAGLNVNRSGGDTYNTFVGHSAGSTVTTGNFNTIFGASTGTLLTTGFRNTLIGRSAQAASDSNSTTAIGFQSVTTSSNTITIGASAQTRGISDIGIGFGAGTGNLNTSGSNNIYIGTNTFGSFGGGTVVNCSNNVVIGGGSLGVATFAIGNTSVGSGCLAATTNGGGNSALGLSSLSNITTGSDNTAIGNQTGGSITSGNENVLVGARSNIANDSNNSIVIGRNVVVGVSNAVQIGNSQHSQFALGGANAIPSLIVPNNYYAEAAGVSVGGFYRSRINGSNAFTTYAVTASFTASTTLDVTAVTGTPIAIGQVLAGGTVSVGPPAIYIISQLTGTPGGIGTYQTSAGQFNGTTVTELRENTTTPDIVYMRTV